MLAALFSSVIRLRSAASACLCRSRSAAGLSVVPGLGVGGAGGEGFGEPGGAARLTPARLPCAAPSGRRTAGDGRSSRRPRPGRPRRGRGPFPGTAAGQLDPAQPAVPVLHPQRPAAPGALALARLPCGTSGRPGTVSAPSLPRPGSRCSCGAGRGPGTWTCPPQGGGRDRPSRRLGVTAGPPAAGARPAGAVPRRRAWRPCRARAAAVLDSAAQDGADDVELAELDAGGAA